MDQSEHQSYTNNLFSDMWACQDQTREAASPILESLNLQLQ